ncbi:uncharacterized protein PHACADRAFT_263132, partial [Phanerochaete carnosa HHB-10118-sp]
MSNTAPGQIETKSPDSLEGKFRVGEDERVYAISITTNETVPPFEVISAELAYNKESDLTGFTSVTGTVAKDLVLYLDHGITIRGKVSYTAVDPAHGISGGGNWALTSELKV